jgi:hypothetical protein
LEEENLMADIRTLKLALLADTKDFVNGLDKAEKESKSFSQKLGGALKAGALAFAALGAAAGAAAIKIGVDAVKAAIEDEASQKQLALALKNSTKATDAQVKATEEYITQAQNATGVTDTQLRSSLGNLLRVTKDVTKATKLNNLALDISAATGKDVETVSQALARAYGGNTLALQKLDPSLRDVIKSGASTEEVFAKLGETFKGAAAAAADTFAGRMEIIKRRLEDAQETIGYALLPILERFAKFVQNNVVPVIEGLVAGLTGKQRSVVPAFLTFGEVVQDAESAGYDLGKALRDLGGGLGQLAGQFESETSTDSGFVRFINLLTRMVEGLDSLFAKLDAAVQKFRDFKTAFDNSLIGQFAGATGQFAPENAPGAQTRASLTGSRTPTIIVNNNIKTAVDPQATARAITKVVNTALSTTGISFINPAFR